MRVMAIVKATKDSEAGVMPSEELLTAMGKYNEEAVEWVERCPDPMPGDSELEIRQVFEMDDFGAEFTPELRKQQRRPREQADRLAGATRS